MEALPPTDDDSDNFFKYGGAWDPLEELGCGDMLKRDRPEELRLWMYASTCVLEAVEETRGYADGSFLNCQAIALRWIREMQGNRPGRQTTALCYWLGLDRVGA